MEYCLAWWNVENLFDTERSPERPRWLQKKLKKELAGWNATVLGKKIRQLASVIVAMNDGAGPDILGVCEVESRRVLEKLTAALGSLHRDYGIVHAESADQRGIDIAFIYDKDLFEVDEDAIFNKVVLKRNATRDILQATFRTKEYGNEFILLGNHWPSRSGGELESAPYRMMAGETMAYWHERIIEKKGEIPVFALGDFNDEPFDVSLEEYALATRSERKVKSARSRNRYFLNLMWGVLERAPGTHCFEGVWSYLDQALVNRAGLKREGIYCETDGVEVFSIPGMISSTKPLRFSRPSASYGFNENGFSDHLPLVVTLKECAAA